MGPSSDRHERAINVIGFAFAFFAPFAARAADASVGVIEFAAPPVNGIGLLLAGIVLLALEAHLFTFGAIGALGVAAFCAGLLLWYTVGGVSLSFVIPCMAFFILIAVGLVVVGYRTRKMKFGQGVESLVGRTGQVMETRDGGGMVSVHGEIWAFTAAGDSATAGRFAVGDKVEVVSQTNLVLTVRKSL